MTPVVLGGFLSRARTWHRRAMAYDGSPAATSRAGLIFVCSYLMANAVAWVVCRALPISLAELDEANSIGIRSIAVLAGYPKSHEFTVYLVWEICVITLTIGFWWGWSVWCGRSITPGVQGDPWSSKPSMRDPKPQRRWFLDWILIPILVAYAQFDIGRFVTHLWTWDFRWLFFSEEGMILAVADRLLHGGVLYRDEFALYGPLMFYPVSWLMRIFDSVLTLRVYAFVLDSLGLLLLYHALLVFFRRRGWAALGLGFYLLNYSLPLAALAEGTTLRPSIHQSVLRYSIGLAWLLFYLRDPEGPRRRDLVLTGVALGVALTFSHEIGVVSSVSFVILVLSSGLWGIQMGGTRRQLLYAALGFASVAVPWMIVFASQGALQTAITNLFIYPRYIGLGYAGLPFPSLGDLWMAFMSSFRNPSADALSTLKGYWIPWMTSLGAIALGVRLLQGRLDRDDRILWALLLLAGMLFKMALGRSDIVHYQASLVPAVMIALMLARRFATCVRRKRIPVYSWSFSCCIAVSLLSVMVLQPPRAVFSAFVYGNLFPFDHKFNVAWWNEDEWRPLAGIPRARGVLVSKGTASEFEDVVHYIVSHTSPSDSIVAFPNEAAYYYYADRPNATRFSIAYLAVTSKDREQMIAEMEENRPPYVIYSRVGRPDNISELTQVPELVEYLDRAYVLVERIGDTSILKRREFLILDRQGQ